MEYIAFPLRTEARGGLARSNRNDVVLALIQAIALTPAGTWPPDPDFGLANHFQGPVMVGLSRNAINALNRCFAKLGLADVQVKEIKRVSTAGPMGEQVSYSVTILTTDEGPISLHLNAPTE